LESNYCSSAVWSAFICWVFPGEHQERVAGQQLLEQPFARYVLRTISFRISVEVLKENADFLALTTRSGARNLCISQGYCIILSTWKFEKYCFTSFSLVK
jgi:hypothetical protein